MGNVNRGELGEEQAHEPLRGAESSAARAPSPALAPGVSQILALQRSAGNAAVALVALTPACSCARGRRTRR